MTLEDVYQEHFGFVWRSLRRLGIGASDVEDAVQDVFLVVQRRLGDFEGRSKVTTWLYAICFRVANDRRRRAHVRREVSGIVEEPRDDQADVAAEVERREAIRFLERVLLEMPIDQRAVFSLFELEHLSCEDIAEALNVPLGTIYSGLRLARGVFRRALGRRRAREGFDARMVQGGSP